LTKSSITLAECAEIMRRKNIENFLISEIKEDGLGVDLCREAKETEG